MLENLLKKVMFPPSGKYVLAVSGGVDSVVLLDIMASKSKIKNRKLELNLVVAHFDHGMRPGSGEDLKFVQGLAQKYDLKFQSAKGRLGQGATEEQARKARYQFLKRVSSKWRGSKVVTAHHLDDALETAIFNAGRGADYLGLTPLHLNKEILRPFLGVRKHRLVEYARAKDLQWREDPTNKDLALTRNFIRRVILPSLTPADIKRFKQQVELNRQVQQEAAENYRNIAVEKGKAISISRTNLLELDFEQAKALLRLAVRRMGASIEQKQLESLVVFCKTAMPPKKQSIGKKLQAASQSDKIVLLEKTAG